MIHIVHFFLKGWTYVKVHGRINIHRHVSNNQKGSVDFNFVVDAILVTNSINSSYSSRYGTKYPSPAPMIIKHGITIFILTVLSKYEGYFVFMSSSSFVKKNSSFSATFILGQSVNFCNDFFFVILWCSFRPSWVTNKLLSKSL